MGRSYAERQRERVACEECGEVIAVGSMSSHLMTWHEKSAARRHLWAPQTDGGPRTYKMSFPEKGGRRRCPVEGCPGVLATRTAMRVHFVHRHVHDTVVMLEEGNLPLPRCPGATSSSPGRRSMGATWVPSSAGRGRNGNGDGWRRWRCRKNWNGRSTPMESQWRRCRSFATSGDC